MKGLVIESIISDEYNWEKSSVIVDDKKVGEIRLALACGPFGNELYRWCYRKVGEPTFDWLTGVAGKDDKSKQKAIKKLLESL